MSVKAFEIVPCIDDVQPPIRCLECCGKNLYVGTTDSFLLHYLVEERRQPQLHLQCTKQKQKYLGVKKPVLTIKSASTLNRLLVLCDGTLFLLNTFDLEPVQSNGKIKGVSSFCINPDPHSNNRYSLEVCVARKRSLQIHNVMEDKIIPVKDVPVPETPNAMAMNGKYVCVALMSKYVLVDCETGSVEEILPYGIIMTNPLIVRISEVEFLLNGPNSLGVFVTTARISERPPLQWSESVTCVTFSYPYILVLDYEALVVYSILDYKQKQRIQFPSGCCLANYEGKVFVASSSSVFALVSVPWEKQVQALLADRRVNEALELACHWPGLNREQFRKTYKRIQQEAGFIEFSEFRFDRARELFVSSQLDPRELISLYSGVLPASSSFVRSALPLHGIANTFQMCRDDERKVVECRDFLVSYLEEAREIKSNYKCQKDVDAVLLKLYAEINSPELTTLIVAADCGDYVAECAECLRRHERYHALALFYGHHGCPEKALDIWMELLDGGWMDDSFPGLPFVVEVLANLEDYSLLWNYAGHVLNKDQETGAKIFTDRSQARNGQLCAVKPEAVTSFLQQYPDALVKYLEHLVFVSDNRKEAFHTHLAVLYLDNAIDLSKEKDGDPTCLTRAREKLQRLLRHSSEYRYKYLLSRLQNTDFHVETALLHGKLEEHDEALRLLVHKLNDPQAAREYCRHYASDRDVPYQQKLYHTLLGIYLDPSLTPEQQDNMFQPTISLLNCTEAEFDAVTVLQLLPDHWSVSSVDQFLKKATRRAMSTRRLKQIEKSLAKRENVRTRFAQYWTQRTAVKVTEEKVCACCGRPFATPEFAHVPGGDLVHLHCLREAESGAVRSRPSGNMPGST